jgi:hypothetical protein
MGVQLDPDQPEPISYIESLRERVRQLELHNADAQRSPSSTLAAGQMQFSHRVSKSFERELSEQALAPSVARQSASHETRKHVMDYLPLSAMAEPRDRQHTSRRQYSFETFLDAATSVSGADVSRSDTSSASLTKSIEDFNKDVVPSGFRLSRSVTDSAVQHYLSVCDILCPFLDREVFLAKHASILREGDEGYLQNVATTAPHDLFLFYISIATGTFLSTGFRYKESFATSLAHKAFRLLPRIMKESDNPLVVQSLIALAIFSIHSPLGGSPWHLVGLALARSMSAGEWRTCCYVKCDV